MLAKAAMGCDMVAVCVGPRSHVQLSFTGDGGRLSGPERVQLGVHAEVMRILRTASVDSQWPAETDLQPRELGLSREQWDALLALRGARAFPADAKTYVLTCFFMVCWFGTALASC